MAALRRTTEAPSQPIGRRGRISGRWMPRYCVTVPLQSHPNASPFWAMMWR